MSDPIIGPVKLDGINFETWLLKFDKHGTCESKKTQQALLQYLHETPPPAIVLFSHGWNNEYRDATGLYGNFLIKLQEHFADHPPNIPLLFVGIIWPSTWLSFDTGPQIGSAGTTVPGGPTDLQMQSSQNPAEELAATLDMRDRQTLISLQAKARLDQVEAKQLTALLSRALRDVGGHAPEALESTAPDADELFRALTLVQHLTMSSAIADDTNDDAHTLIGSLGDPQAAGLLDIFDPRNAIRIASVYQMKDRAGTVGTNGVSALLSQLRAAAPDVPLHLVGHSFGAKVVMSALASYQGKPVESVLLLQPAISYLCMAEALPDSPHHPGAFYGVPAKVRQPLMITYSGHDWPLHDFYHLALLRKTDPGEFAPRSASSSERAGEPPSKYAALGGYGPPGSNATHGYVPLAGDTSFHIRLGDPPLALDGTIGKRIDGHGDVTTPITAWLLYLQLRKAVQP
jgi:hypothetical protein